MALPTLVKTYEFDVNNAAGTSSTVLADHQKTLWGLKEALTGGYYGGGSISTKPWSVIKACDSTAVASSDNLDVSTDLVWGTGAHSWMVLQSGGTNPAQVCWDCNVANSYELDILLSPSGAFTGGTTTARPTAADELELWENNYGAWCGVTGAFSSKVHAYASTDGETSMAIVYVGGDVRVVWRMDKATNPITGWDGYMVWIGHTYTPDNLFDFSDSEVPAGSWWPGKYACHGELSLAYQLSYEATGSTELAVMVDGTFGINDWTSAYHMIPCGIKMWSPGYRGKVGMATDLWWGQTLALATMYPSSGQLYQFAHAGHIVMPWDQTTVIQTS